MKLAVVGWATDSGVGRELIDACRHLPVSSAFLLQHPSRRTRTELLSHIQFMVSSEDRAVIMMGKFIEQHRPDTILSWEVPGHWSFPEIWSRNGLRWVHLVHWDWFPASERHLACWRKAHLLAPNAMCERLLKETFGLRSELLPVPIDTDRIRFRERSRADVFISVYGHGGPHQRRSWPEILSAWSLLKNGPPLIVRAQTPPEYPGIEALPHGVQVLVAELPEPSDLYATGDVAVQPSRYEGVGVSMLEAQASGMPVIAVDAEPMNEIVPHLRIPALRTTEIRLMSKPVASHMPSAAALAEAVRSLRGSDIRQLSRGAREFVENRYSWKQLKSGWLGALSA